MEDGKDDLYEILGINSGSNSSINDIKKAYRKRALESHPDKRPGDKNAAVEFNRIQKAYEVLSDESARRAYDDLKRLERERAERSNQQSVKRQKMVADLVAREKAAASQRSEVEIARSRLKAELERIRKMAANKRQAGTVDQSDNANKGPPQAEANLGLSASDMLKTLKVSWSSRDGEISGEEYPVWRLREIFGEFGVVEDVLVREKKKKRKGSALVVMASADAAELATRSLCGDVSNPLLVVPAASGIAPPPEPPVAQGASIPQNQKTESRSMAPDTTATGTTAGVFSPGFGGPKVGAAYTDYESLTLTRMRQAGERARLIREMADREKQMNNGSEDNLDSRV